MEVQVAWPQVPWSHRQPRYRCRHMVLLKEQYGKQVVVNLLGSRGGEEVLNRAFKVTLTLLPSRGWMGRGRVGAPLTW